MHGIPDDEIAIFQRDAYAEEQDDADAKWKEQVIILLSEILHFLQRPNQ